MSILLTPPEVVQVMLDGKKVEIRGVIASQNNKWKPLNEHEIHIGVLTNGLFMFRLAQEMITVGDVSFPKPESRAPEIGDMYYIPRLNASTFRNQYHWDGSEADQSFLKAGLVHLTKENAIAHAKALIKLSGGECE